MFLLLNSRMFARTHTSIPGRVSRRSGQGAWNVLLGRNRSGVTDKEQQQTNHSASILIRTFDFFFLIARLGLSHPGLACVLETGALLINNLKEKKRSNAVHTFATNI